jgi:outer membrane lipoprotein-sorting protein
MLRFSLIFFLTILTSFSNAEIKDKIIDNLKNTNNLDFKFEQNVNGKIENGNCTIEYPKKIFCEYARSNNLINFTIFDRDNEINIFFDKQTYDLVGWQNTDIYQNFNITFLSSIRKNRVLSKNLFKIPIQN